jgi:hypothetical protein
VVDDVLPNPDKNPYHDGSGIQGIEIICGVFFGILVLTAIAYFICEKKR